MSTQIQLHKQFLTRPAVVSKFAEMLGEKRASAFLTSVLQVVSQNTLLQKATTESIFHAAATAASIDLPINNSLGFAYIVPYKGQAQFQISYKGLIQLCQRSGQFRTISASPIYAGQLVSENPLTGFEFDFTVKASGSPIGYAAYFELINGFKKTLYMSKEQVQEHAGKYSQTFKKGYGVWKDEFDSMAQKTVLKLLLGKYAPMSVEMQKATIADQGVVKDSDTLEVEYIDNDNSGQTAELNEFLSDNEEATK